SLAGSECRMNVFLILCPSRIQVKDFSETVTSWAYTLHAIERNKVNAVPFKRVMRVFIGSSFSFEIAHQKPILSRRRKRDHARFTVLCQLPGVRSPREKAAGPYFVSHSNPSEMKSLYGSMTRSAVISLPNFRFAIFFHPLRSPESQIRFVEAERH